MQESSEEANPDWRVGVLLCFSASNVLCPRIFIMQYSQNSAVIQNTHISLLIFLELCGYNSCHRTRCFKQLTQEIPCFLSFPKVHQFVYEGPLL
jgi:hypothetical protein